MDNGLKTHFAERETIWGQLSNREQQFGTEVLKVIEDRESTKYYSRKVPQPIGRNEYFDFCYGSHFPEQDREDYWLVGFSS